MAHDPVSLPGRVTPSGNPRRRVRLLLKFGIGVVLGGVTLSLLSAGVERFQDASDRAT